MDQQDDTKINNKTNNQNLLQNAIKNYQNNLTDKIVDVTEDYKDSSKQSDPNLNKFFTIKINMIKRILQLNKKNDDNIYDGMINEYFSHKAKKLDQENLNKKITNIDNIKINDDIPLSAMLIIMQLIIEICETNNHFKVKK